MQDQSVADLNPSVSTIKLDRLYFAMCQRNMAPSEGIALIVK